MKQKISPMQKPEPLVAPEGSNFLINYWYKYRNYRRLSKWKRTQPQTFQEKLISWTKTIVGAIIVVMIINGLAIASFVVPTGSMENTVMTGDFLFVNKFIYGPTTPQVIPFLNIPLPFIKFPGFYKPEKGDVIVFIYPGDRDEIKSREFNYYLKRCVAVSGDTLQIINKKLYANGVEYPLAPNGKFLLSKNEQPALFPIGSGFSLDNYGPYRIPKSGDIVELNAKTFNQWKVFIQREGHTINFDGSTVSVDNQSVTQYTVERDYCFGMGDNRDNSLDSRSWGLIPMENVVGSPILVYWSWDTNLPFSQFFKKLGSVRWDRIGNFIK